MRFLCIFVGFSSNMKLKFKRPKQFTDMIRAYRIIIDGKRVGNIRDGEEKELEIPEGRREIFLKIDWCASNALIINDTKDEKEFLCYNTFAGWKMFTLFIPLYYITFGRKRHLTLKEI